MKQIKLHLRKGGLSPLLVIGKWTLWFTTGIAFGIKYNPASITYYVGWLLISVKTKYHIDFVKQVNAGTWPKTKIWIVKYKKWNIGAQ